MWVVVFVCCGMWVGVWMWNGVWLAVFVYCGMWVGICMWYGIWLAVCVLCGILVLFVWFMGCGMMCGVVWFEVCGVFVLRCVAWTWYVVWCVGCNTCL